jgi:hypothetical protein
MTSPLEHLEASGQLHPEPGYSLLIGERQHEDERATELLDQIYEDWDQMAAPERWEVSHLDEVPATYDHVRDVLRARHPLHPHLRRRFDGSYGP